MCFCCHDCITAYDDSEFCGNVDCNVNYIYTKLSIKYCKMCVTKKCNEKKEFCVLHKLRQILTVDKSMNAITLF